MFFFTEKWIGFNFLVFMKILSVDSFSKRQKGYSIFPVFFQVKEVLYLFQLKSSFLLKFSAVLSTFVTRWNGVCRMNEDQRTRL